MTATRSFCNDMKNCCCSLRNYGKYSTCFVTEQKYFLVARRHSSAKTNFYRFSSCYYHSLSSFVQPFNAVLSLFVLNKFALLAEQISRTFSLRMKSLPIIELKLTYAFLDARNGTSIHVSQTIN